MDLFSKKGFAREDERAFQLFFSENEADLCSRCIVAVFHPRREDRLFESWMGIDFLLEELFQGTLSNVAWAKDLRSGRNKT